MLLLTIFLPVVIYCVGLRSFGLTDVEDVKFRFEKPDHIEPIIICHGVAACQLNSKLHHAKEPLFYCFHNEEWTLLWINVVDIIPYLSSPCFIHNLQVHYNESNHAFYNNEGVEIQVNDFGGTKGIEYLSNVIKSLGKYFYTFVEYFVQAGYERNKSIRGALVDWRLSPQDWIEKGTFEDIKNLVEETYEINGNTSVHLLGHSMGGPVFSLFLSQYVNQAWKDKYIKSFFSVAGAYDGGYEALADMIYGRYEPLPSDLTPTSTSLGGLHWQVPFYNYQDEVVIYTPEKNYTMSMIDEIFEKIGKANNADIYHYTHKMDCRKAPNVTTHCLQGYGRKTPKAFYFKELKMGEKYETVDWFDDGDCTVFPKSFGVCDEWANDPAQSFPVDVQKFSGKAFPAPKDYHRYIVNDPEVLEAVYKTIYGNQGE